MAVIGSGVMPVRPTARRSVSVAELAACAGVLFSGAADRMVSGVALRTRDVQPGDLYVTPPRPSTQDTDLVKVALAAGAVAVLTDTPSMAHAAMQVAAVPVLKHPRLGEVLGQIAARVYGDPTAELVVLGVTGTSGKTTTSYLIEAGLRAAGLTTGLVGTLGARVAGQPLAEQRLTGGPATTPDAPDLQALFAVMLERGVSHATMEVTSHALVRGRVDGTRFDVGAFTNLSHDHLDFHTDMEDYFAAKARLFDGRCSIEVVNVDDPWGARLVHPDTVTVSLTKPAATWHASVITTHSDGGQSFTAYGPDGAGATVRIALSGQFNAANALLALACLHAAGVSPQQAAAGLSTTTVPGRTERVDAGQPFLAMVDYAHKPAAVAALLDALRAQLAGSRSAGRLLVVLGCGGERDTVKRPLMGQAAAARAELLVVTDDNPRTEDPAQIRAAMLAGARQLPATQRGEVLEIGDRRAAIAEVVARAAPHDVVVIAGKGHETSQLVGTVRHPFSDADELAAAIRAAATLRR
ncbi:MAG: UDP-N-acetylmuramoyl-L-alanyl-D-glutamate--2,6-diaminopimelate ligase [Pseudonocardiaceae bacterium]